MCPTPIEETQTSIVLLNLPRTQAEMNTPSKELGNTKKDPSLGLSLAGQANTTQAYREARGESRGKGDEIAV